MRHRHVEPMAHFVCSIPCYFFLATTFFFAAAFLAAAFFLAAAALAPGLLAVFLVGSSILIGPLSLSGRTSSTMGSPLMISKWSTAWMDVGLGFLAQIAFIRMPTSSFISSSSSQKCIIRVSEPSRLIQTAVNGTFIRWPLLGSMYGNRTTVKPLSMPSGPHSTHSFISTSVSYTHLTLPTNREE